MGDRGFIAGGILIAFGAVAVFLVINGVATDEWLSQFPHDPELTVQGRRFDHWTGRCLREQR